MILFQNLLCLSFFSYATSFPLHLFLLRIYIIANNCYPSLHFVFPFKKQLPVLTGSFLARNSDLLFLHHDTFIKNQLLLYSEDAGSRFPRSVGRCATSCYGNDVCMVTLCCNHKPRQNRDLALWNSHLDLTISVCCCQQSTALFVRPAGCSTVTAETTGTFLPNSFWRLCHVMSPYRFLRRV
jgi:hypothetical protein